MLAAVDSRRNIEVIVPHLISTNSSHVLREGQIHESGGGRFRRKIITSKRVAPHGSRVPKILECWTVVERNSVQHVLAHELSRIGVANISVVPGEMVVLSVVGKLDEA